MRQTLWRVTVHGISHAAAPDSELRYFSFFSDCFHYFDAFFALRWYFNTLIFSPLITTSTFFIAITDTPIFWLFDIGFLSFSWLILPLMMSFQYFFHYVDYAWLSFLSAFLLALIFRFFSFIDIFRFSSDWLALIFRTPLRRYFIDAYFWCLLPPLLLLITPLRAIYFVISRHYFWLLSCLLRHFSLFWLFTPLRHFIVIFATLLLRLMVFIISPLFLH